MLWQPVMSRRQIWIFRGLIAAWVAATLSFWHWWLESAHLVSWTGMLFTSLPVLWGTCLPAWYFFFAHRMRQLDPETPLPRGRVAMIVTKTPSEPWSMVRKTLEAMLTQEFPRDFDVWLADEDPSEATRAWCAAYGVRISSRKGVLGYNNPTWPGRQKCKEGNLRYFHEVMGGYAAYDFVVQFDADHVPEKTYLLEMIRPFADPQVGYVAAPSICDANAQKSWAARARLYAEAPLHGALQAGQNDGYVPMCFGSHYAVRTVALSQIGGLGPELAEDHSTTLMMNAAGWHGAFALRAIAHGDGPETLADCMTQERQWSRSLTKLLLVQTPMYWGGLDVRARCVFAFFQLWYPLSTLSTACALLIAPAALLTRSAWVNVDILEFLARSGLIALCALLSMGWVRSQGWLRPANARLISWEPALFELVRWPWVLVGISEGILSVALRREITFNVTPKQVNRAQPLPLALLLPYVLLAVGQAAVAVLVSSPGDAGGYYNFVLLNALTYTAVSAAIVAAHLSETLVYQSGRLTAWLTTLFRSVPAVALSGAMSFSALGLRGAEAVFVAAPAFAAPAQRASYDGDAEPVLRQAAAAEAAVAAPVLDAPSPPAPVEATHLPAEAVDASESRPTPIQGEPRAPVQPLDLALDGVSVGAYDPHLALTGENLGIEHWYISQADRELMAGALAHARNHRTPMVTVEPYPAPGDHEPVLESILTGRMDDELYRLAGVVRDAAPQIVLIRWGHEMDLSGLYPWAANRPDLFRAAFRHVVSIFRDTDVSNARFVWSPAGQPSADDYFPGDDVVDYVGLTILGDADWDAGFGLPPQSFAELLKPRYVRVQSLGKPIIIAEAGVSGTHERQSEWLAEAAQSLVQFPDVRALVYFDDRNPPVRGLATRPDWRVEPALLRHLIADTDSLHHMPELER